MIISVMFVVIFLDPISTHNNNTNGSGSPPDDSTWIECAICFLPIAIVYIGVGIVISVTSYFACYKNLIQLDEKLNVSNITTTNTTENLTNHLETKNVELETRMLKVRGIKKLHALSHFPVYICDKLKALPSTSQKKIKNNVIGIIQKEKKIRGKTRKYSNTQLSNKRKNYIHIEIVRITTNKPKPRRPPQNLCVILWKRIKGMSPSSQYRIQNILLGLVEIEAQKIELEDEATYNEEGDYDESNKISSINNQKSHNEGYDEYNEGDEDYNKDNEGDEDYNENMKQFHPQDDDSTKDIFVYQPKQDDQELEEMYQLENELLDLENYNEYIKKFKKYHDYKPQITYHKNKNKNNQKRPIKNNKMFPL